MPSRKKQFALRTKQAEHAHAEYVADLARRDKATKPVRAGAKPPKQAEIIFPWLAQDAPERELFDPEFPIVRDEDEDLDETEGHDPYCNIFDGLDCNCGIENW